MDHQPTPPNVHVGVCNDESVAISQSSDKTSPSTTPSISLRHPSMHALVLSFPIQGHITPLTQLARRLSRHGFRITFIVTDHTLARSPRSPSPSSSSGRRLHVYPMPSQSDTHSNAVSDVEFPIRMINVPDGLPANHPRDRGFADQELAMIGMRVGVEHLLRSLQRKPGGVVETRIPSDDDYDGPVDCIISDVFVTWSADVAASFSLPLVSVYTANATSASILYHTQFLIDKGIIPFVDADNGRAKVPVDCIPGVLPLLPSEFPPSMQNREISAPRLQFTLRMFGRIHECAALLLNTAYELEPRTIDSLRCERNLPVFPVGPLFLPDSSEAPLPTESDLTFWAEDDRCVSWLDQQPDRSVLYVSFGSIASHEDTAQLRELALGIEASRHPFLWVIRPGSVHRSLVSALPDGFLDRTLGRGLIVSWAPQLKVLAHPAVSCFLTHCGWNSVLESLSMGGVPMLCWPDMADQMVNRRLLVDVWRVGLEFRTPTKGHNEGIVDREEVEAVIRRLMESDEGRECGRRAGELRDLLLNAVKSDGSSAANLHLFLERVHTLSLASTQ